MTQTLSPSSIARRIASHEWPDVQQSIMVARGVYEFSCAGHGGMVAIVGVADIAPEAVEVARKHNFIERFYILRQTARSTKLYLPSDWYTPESRARFDDWIDAHRDRIVVEGEAWVGEEDCAWASIVAASPSIHEAWLKPAFRQGMEDYPRQSLSQWYPQYLADLDAALGVNA